MSKCKLFCVPFAGGSAFSFSNWLVELKDQIRIVPVELSAKEFKAGGEFHQTFSQVLQEALQPIKECARAGEAYALFGHSMGALLAFELYYAVDRLHLVLPEYIILSAISPPDKFSCRKIVSKSESDFETYVTQMGGLPEGILENKSMKESALKTIRKDYDMMATYKYSHYGHSITCPGYILQGSEDKIVTENDAGVWGGFFQKPVKVITINGGHFFINGSFHTVMEIIKRIDSKRI